MTAPASVPLALSCRLATLVYEVFLGLLIHRETAAEAVAGEEVPRDLATWFSLWSLGLGVRSLLVGLTMVALCVVALTTRRQSDTAEPTPVDRCLHVWLVVEIVTVCWHTVHLLLLLPIVLAPDPPTTLPLWWHIAVAGALCALEHLLFIRLSLWQRRHRQREEPYFL